MFQPTLRRTFAAAAFTALTSLLPLSGLEAAPLGREGQPGRARAAERLEQGELSLWRILLHLTEKFGIRIDDNGNKFGMRIDDNGTKFGMRIDDNG
jgi:hypothetical protein